MLVLDLAAKSLKNDALPRIRAALASRPAEATSRERVEPLCIQFSMGPTEACNEPAIYMDSPTGGDPWILATIKRVYREELLHEAFGHANIYRRAASTPKASDEGEAS